LSQKQLEQLLTHYVPSDEYEEKMRCEILAFLKRCKNPFGKQCEAGHITASAWIIDQSARQVLLTHHAKLNKWFQLGGHTEVGETIYEAVMREAVEESGIAQFEYVNKHIFDVDVHMIPENAGIPEHYHYDIRFLLKADCRSELTVSDESHDVKWVPIEKIRDYSESESILRMVRKILEIDIATTN